MDGDRNALSPGLSSLTARTTGLAVLGLVTVSVALSVVVATTDSVAGPPTMSSSEEKRDSGLDIYLVLDVSASIGRNGLLLDMKRGAKAFVRQFDEANTRIGLVTFSTTGTVHHRAAFNSMEKLTTDIDHLEALTDTNIQDGLRRAQKAFRRLSVDLERRRLVVLFSDGMPTALTDRFRFFRSGRSRELKAAIASYMAGEGYRGLFRLRDGRKIIGFDDALRSITTENISIRTSPFPTTLGNGAAISGTNIRAYAAIRTQDKARKLRESGITLHVVALIDPDATNAGNQLESDFMHDLADGNEPATAHGQVRIVQQSKNIRRAFLRLAASLN